MMARAKKEPEFQPTPEQVEALADYKAWCQRVGLSWRTQLLADFTRAGSEWPGDWSLLQRVRNSTGGIDWSVRDDGRVDPVESDMAQSLTLAQLRVLGRATKGTLQRGRVAYGLSRRGLLEPEGDGLDELRGLLSWGGPKKKKGTRYGVTSLGVRVYRAAREAGRFGDA